MRRTMTVLAAGALALGAGGMLAACDSDDSAEEAVEDIAGGDVDIDEDGVNIETDEGSASFGTCDELPDDFPSDVPTPDAEPQACTSTSIPEGGSTWSVSYSSSDEGAFDEYRTALEDADFEVEGELSASDSDGTFSSVTATNDDYTVNITNVGAGEERLINLLVTEN